VLAYLVALRAAELAPAAVAVARPNREVGRGSAPRLKDGARKATLGPTIARKDAVNVKTEGLIAGTEH